MAKVLVIDYNKCTGCRTCEMACSLKHEGMTTPALSRVQVIRWDIEGEGTPIVCNHCEPAPCIDACPTNARYRDEEGRVITNHERCIKCRTCMMVCPFGAIGFNSVTRRIFNCDLCNGNPICVEFCPYDALHYLEEGEVRRKVAQNVAARLREAKQIIVNP